MKTVPDPELADRTRQYWNERAHGTERVSLQATTYDVFLRELEIAKLKERISAASFPPGSTIVDCGCGDGYATVSLATAFPTLRFIGVDYSYEMLAIAETRLLSQPGLPDRVSFRLGDMRRLSTSLGDEKFEAFTSMRSLINLTSSIEQYDTIAQIAQHLKPGGYYFCIENFTKGQENFNGARRAMGLPDVPVRWHNHFFDDDVFMVETAKNFDALHMDSFLSSYYLATRVIYSAGCQLAGEEPDYFHPIHRTAGRLPPIGDFCPIRLASMRRKF